MPIKYARKRLDIPIAMVGEICAAAGQGISAASASGAPPSMTRDEGPDRACSSDGLRLTAFAVATPKCAATRKALHEGWGGAGPPRKAARHEEDVSDLPKRATTTAVRPKGWMADPCTPRPVAIRTSKWYQFDTPSGRGKWHRADVDFVTACGRVILDQAELFEVPPTVADRCQRCERA